jgi:uncharacterized protein
LAKLPSREQPVRYGIFLGGIVILGTISAALVRIRSGFVYPPFFDLFRASFFLQYGFFEGAILATLLALASRLRLPRFVQWLCYFIFHFWLLWILSWGLVHRAFGIELSFGSVIDLFAHPPSIAEVGFTSTEFVSTVIGAIAIAALLAAVSLALVSRVTRRTIGLWSVALVIAFLFIHLPVRAYCVYQINRNQAAVLAYDDCVACSLRSETLIPHLRNTRFGTPDLASSESNLRYYEKLKTMTLPLFPRRPNILWLNIESFRADAIDSESTPSLWRQRDHFQLRLQHEYWSGGNATQFGLFSMLTGVSGHHFANFQKFAVKAPFLRLLLANGYQLSGGKESYFSFNQLNALLPQEMKLPEIRRTNPAKEDRLTVDYYLRERQSPSNGPRFDFIPFDATHWPYWFPPEHEIFKPAPLTKNSQHVLRSSADMQGVRNRYRNACHFIDEQIGRLFDDLQRRNEFDNTIIIVLGDHGEEFQERGQLTHAAVLNDFQGRTLLWMHLPDLPSVEISPAEPTTHLDIIPTLLSALGFSEDVLFTQGRSLLEQPKHRDILALCENGFRQPLYRALVTGSYISRWAYRPREYLFSGVQRRDGQPVSSDDWLGEVRAHLNEAAQMYEVLPDVSQEPRKFDTR